MKRAPVKLALLACLPLALAACGTIPVGSAPLPDVILNLPSTGVLPITATSPVVYYNEDQFKQSGGIPGLVNNLSIVGTAEYVGTGNVDTVDVYVRQNLNNLSNCTTYGQYVVCGGDESGQLVGQLDFRQSKRQDFSFGNGVLLNAARAGHAYFGVKVASSGFGPADQLKFTNMRAVAKF